MTAEQTYVSSFPFSRIRDEQRKAIEFALDAFQRGKRFVILELGTGCGKSATAVTVARHIAKVQVSDAYVLTTQKVLQEQYLDDFGPTSRNMLTSIKSSSNYTCSFYQDQSCGESRRILTQVKTTAGTDFAKHCKAKCPYAADKQSFLNSPLGVTNFSYFLAETMYAGTLEPRDILIIDECHNTESELSRFVEVTFSEKFAKDVLKCRPPVSGSQEEVFKWVKGTYKRACSKYFKSLEASVKGKITCSNDTLGEMGKQYEMLDKHICKVNRFINTYDSTNWVLNVVHPPPNQKRAAKKYEFKTIDVSRYSEDMLFKFGKRVLMLSATIIDKETFCRSVGIPLDEAEFLSIPSPFPAENRPIHFMPVGSMSKANIDTTLPRMAEAVKAILDLHVNDKGIIHCLDENSLIRLADGTDKPIKDITVKDEVVTWNDQNKSFESRTVSHTYDNGERNCVELKFSNGMTLVCTPEHLIMTKNRGWVMADELRFDDDILDIVHDTYVRDRSSKNW